MERRFHYIIGFLLLSITVNAYPKILWGQSFPRHYHDHAFLEMVESALEKQHKRSFPNQLASDKDIILCPRALYRFLGSDDWNRAHWPSKDSMKKRMDRDLSDMGIRGARGYG